ncbi:MAG: YicC family protein [Clostridiales bacterium]|nr:YicC family protein [Clostridiales bacterium]MDY3745274.1 YicC/YloC family endoribonuclease [Lachnospiraceae bacterium]
MIKSMTGFGRCEVADENRKMIVEMKAVNHRYCDINIKIPKKLGFFESTIRALMKKYIQRGKIDVFITYEDYTEHNVCLKYNQELAAEYYEKLCKMSEYFGIDNDIKVSHLSRYPEILTLEEQTVDEEELLKLIEKAVCGACEKFVETRVIEGEQLKNDLLGKLDGMLTMVAYIEERSPQIVREYQDKLTAKVNELLENSTVDENRILTEVTIFADKICVDEETVRLKSHIQSAKDTLLAGGGVGRKLDFIAQEMNREANTILSKANDLDISNKAIDLKTEIEKVREQIQNIE